jgi:gluconolactonase
MTYLDSVSSWLRPATTILALTLLLVAHQAILAEDKPALTVGHVERLDPALDKLIPADSKMEVIGSGYAWCESPVWVPSGQFLLFSDIPHNAIMRWDAKSGSKLYLKPSGYTANDARGGESGSNGLVLDRNGRLVLCQHGDRRVARLDTSLDDPQPKFTTLAARYQDKKLNSPNDAVVDSHNAIYFTDPPYGLEKGMDDPKKELPFQGVFRIGPSGKLSLLTKELERPNGIALSPDEKTLYVANSYEQRPVIMAYELHHSGAALGPGRVFFDARSLAGKPGACDGMTVDAKGNLFATIPGGVGIFGPDGKQLGLLDTGDRTANCDFGGSDASTLFIAANNRVLRIKTSTKGIGF